MSADNGAPAAAPQVDLPGISPGTSGGGAPPAAPAVPKSIDGVVDAVMAEKTGAPAKEKAEKPAPLPPELEAALAPFKVGDKEHKVASIEELRQRAQKGFGAEERFEAASKLEREAKAQRAQMQEQLGQLEALLRSPDGLLKIARHTLGAQADDTLIQLAHEVIEERTMPPEERARRQQLRDMQSKEQRLRELEQREQHRQQTAQEAQLTTHYEQQAHATLKSAGLAINEYNVERWAIEMQAQIDAGQRPDPAIAAKAVSERLGKSTLAHLQSLTPEQLLAALDPILPTIRKLDAERLTRGRKNVAQPPPRTETGQFAPREGNGQQRERTSDWLRELLRY